MQPLRSIMHRFNSLSSDVFIQLIHQEVQKRGNYTAWKESSSSKRNEECSVDNYNDMFSLNLLR